MNNPQVAQLRRKQMDWMNQMRESQKASSPLPAPSSSIPSSTLNAPSSQQVSESLPSLSALSCNLCAQISSPPVNLVFSLLPCEHRACQQCIREKGIRSKCLLCGTSIDRYSETTSLVKEEEHITPTARDGKKQAEAWRVELQRSEIKKDAFLEQLKDTEEEKGRLKLRIQEGRDHIEYLRRDGTELDRRIQDLLKAKEALLAEQKRIEKEIVDLHTTIQEKDGQMAIVRQSLESAEQDVRRLRKLIEENGIN